MTQRHLWALAAVLAAVASMACGSTSTSVTTPTAPRCQVTAGASPSAFGPTGGAGTFTVTTDRDCTWSATAGATWVTLGTPASGQGNASFAFTVAANPSVSARSATVDVNGQKVTISQQAAACVYAVSPATLSIPSGGGTVSVSIQTSSACAWTATSNDAWIAVRTPSGTGNGTVPLTVTLNSGAQRTGTVTIGGQTVTITQESGTTAPPPPPACAYSISPASQSFSASAGTGSVAVTTTSACAWSATSSVPWLILTSAPAGSGSGTVTFSVADNLGAARTGTVMIAGQTFTVMQAAGSAPPPPPPSCSYTIAPTAQSYPADGGAGSIAVSTAAACSWSAASNAGWISLTSAPGGTGSGSVAYAVSANTGGARTGTLTVGGQTFTVTQAAAVTPPACSYSVSPSSQQIGAGGGQVSFNVTTAAGCAWTATTGENWLLIANGAAGSGSGPVEIDVQPNQSGTRSANVTIAGRSVTVRQRGADASAEGVVAALSGSCPALQFTVNRSRVLTDGATAFKKGPCKSVENGVNVAVAGTLESDLALLATELTFVSKL